MAEKAAEYALVLLAYFILAALFAKAGPRVGKIKYNVLLFIVNITTSLLIYAIVDKLLTNTLLYSINIERLWRTVFFINSLTVVFACQDIRKQKKYDEFLFIPYPPSCSVLASAVAMFPYIALWQVHNKVEDTLIYVAIIFIYVIYNMYTKAKSPATKP